LFKETAKRANVELVLSGGRHTKACLREKTHSVVPPPLSHFEQLDCLKFLLGLPNIDTEIQNVQGKRAGEGMQELMRDESKDEETIRLLTESRVSQGITRL